MQLNNNILRSGEQKILLKIILDHARREFWWTERVALYGSTKVSVPIWIENNVRISKIACPIRAKEVRILHILFIILIIQLNLNNFNANINEKCKCKLIVEFGEYTFQTFNFP